MSVAKYTVYVLNCIPFDFLSVTFVFRSVDSLMLKAWRQRSGNAPLVLRVRVPGRPKLPVYLISKQPFRAIVCFVLICAPHNLPVALIFAVLSLSLTVFQFTSATIFTYSSTLVAIEFSSQFLCLITLKLVFPRFDQQLRSLLYSRKKSSLWVCLVCHSFFLENLQFKLTAECFVHVK